MTKEQQQVREFFTLANQELKEDGAGWPSINQVEFVWNTLCEEMKELRIAMSNEDLVEVVDALCDLKYFIEGAALRFGVDLEPCFQEVHRSNMTKIWPPGSPREQMFNNYGKYMKPPGYSACKLKPILEAQGAKFTK